MANTSDNRKVSDQREPESRLRKVGDATDRAAERTREAEEQGAAIAPDGLDTTVNFARRMTEEGRETLGHGLQRMAELGAPLADMGYGESRNLIEASARVTDLYHRTTEETAEDMQALVASYTQLGQGLQRMQSTYINMLQGALSHSRRQPRDLLRCKSVTELAEVQRDLYMDGVAFMLDSSTTMFRLAGQVMESAVAPLEARTRTHGRR